MGDTLLFHGKEPATDELKKTFKDGGMEFDPLKRQDPDINAPLEQRQIGGLGIYLCKEMMDSVSYRYENGSNILTMVKKIK